MKIIKGTNSIIGSKEPQHTLPSFTLNSKDLPEIKDWKVGEVYFFKLKAEQIEMGKGEYEFSNYTNSKVIHARFQIIEIESDGKESYEEEYARKRNK